MSQLKELLDQEAYRIDADPDALESTLRRRGRKRRNQRITAGVVGIAVFVAAVWIVTSGGSLHRTQPAVTPSPAPDLEPVPESYQPDPSLSRVNVVDLPPEGASPSSPEDGELVLAVDGRGIAAGRALTHMYLYADGRLIWWREGDLPASADEHAILEQRLTPEGVELLRSEMISSGLFDRGLIFMGGEADPDPLPFWGSMAVRNGDRMVHLQLGWVYFSTEELCEPADTSCEGDTIMTAEQEHALELLDARLFDPASWLPASAWADQQIRTYVPSTYEVCYGGWSDAIQDSMVSDQTRILNALPRPAREPLRGAEPDRRAAGIGTSVTYYCSDLTTEEARVVVRTLEDAGFEREQRPTYANGPAEEYAAATFQYVFSIPDPTETAQILIDPYLPHGPSCVTCA
jgi:hypothetical protein